LSSVKVKFVEKVISLQKLKKESNEGVAVELRIKNVD
jgi:hypothetical protein